MEPQEKHTMMLSMSYPSGAEEWVCPTCGLRFVMQWPPAFKKIILEEGNPLAIHSGGKGGVEMGTPQFKPAEDPHEEIDDPSLDPWLEYIEEMDVNKQLDNSSGNEENPF